MPVEVLVLAAGGADPVMRWEVQGAASVVSDCWAELHRRISHSGSAKPLELYFCFNGAPFENHDRELITALTSASRQYAPGSRQHAVFGTQTITRLDLPFEVDAVADWYTAARRGGLDDVLELPLDRESDAVLPRLLRAACARSETRASVLARFSEKAGRWSAVFADREAKRRTSIPRIGQGILDPYVRYGLLSGTRDPLVIVVRDPKSQAQKNLVEKVLDEHRPLNAVIAVLDSPAENDLKAFCQRKGLDFLHFRGLLELRYFLLRLNSGSNFTEVAENRAFELSRSEGDLYSRYVVAINRLRATFPIGHSKHDDFLAYEERLMSSIWALRLNGPNENEQARLREVLRQLNHLTEEFLGVSFNSLVYPAESA